MTHPHSTKHQPMLKDKSINIDRAKVGISYSGGGPRLILELGAALAFVQRGLVPNAIAGVSAGAMVAAIHALDPVGGRGIQSCMDLWPKRVTSKLLGLSRESVIQKLVLHRGHVQSLGDNGVIRGAVREICQACIGIEQPRIGDLKPPDHPKLLIAASDWLSESAWWFEDDVLIEDAAIASSAIPGVFPWRHHAFGDTQTVLIDGGVISNQPLSRLVMEGCGTIIAIGFRQPEKVGTEPHDALHAVLDSIGILMHHSTHLEEDYVRLKMGDAGDVHSVVIDHQMPSNNYDFSAEVLAGLVDDARSQVKTQLDALGL